MRAGSPTRSGMERILIHPLAGVLSAYGIGLADVKAIRETSWLKPLGEDFSEALADAGSGAPARRWSSSASMPTASSSIAARGCGLPGSDTTIELEIAPVDAMRADFSELHRQRFGYWDEGAEVIVDALVVEAVGRRTGSAPRCRPAQLAG